MPYLTGKTGAGLMVIFKTMQCNRYINDFSLAPSAWAPVNRISFSSVNYCSLQQYDAPTISIKYVTRGTEHYFMDGKKYSVGAGKFLVVNNEQPLDVEVRSKKNVNGFCIHFKPVLLYDVYQNLLHEEEELLDGSQPVNLPAFQSLIYQDGENGLGTTLKNIAGLFNYETGELELDEQSLFYHMAGGLLQLQHKLPVQGKGLQVLKNSTRKELLVRLAMAKQYMDAPGGAGLSIEEIAKAAMFSPSHFFRVFKKHYGISPLQYQLQRKMQKADGLLRTGNYSVTEVAMECGYPDLPSFTHQYKKFFKVPPSKVFDADLS